jgi:L-ascorbate metabolism protein UlaG (beta-lactamase superfamily)
MSDLVVHPLEGTLAEALAGGPSEALRLYWLGQAGFVVDVAGRRLVIDPYLSDSLAEKYPSGPFRYDRLMPPSVTVEELGRVDAMLVTHSHTDHLDPGTLKPLFARNPTALLIAPRAIAALAMERAAPPPGSFVGANAGERIELFDGISITPTRAAHETLKREPNGDHHFLGYVMRCGSAVLWHSGDCVPFDGLVEEIAAHHVDLALLPVNGRRKELSAAGVAIVEKVCVSSRERALADFFNNIGHRSGLCRVVPVCLLESDSK